MRISIIITCHNYGRYLRQCMESVKAQTYAKDERAEIEIIVVDDGSTDDTPTIADELRAKYIFSYIRTEGIGLAAAANTGIRKSFGSYIMRLDADDCLHPDFCLVLSNYLDANADADCVYCDYYKTADDGAILIGDAPTLNEPPLGSCMMYTRSLWEDLGGYQEFLEHQEDFEFWQRLLQRDYKTHHIDLPLWYYRQHDKQMSNNHNAKHRARHAIKEQRGDHPRVLCVIPARGGSKGVPGKNLREIAGIPLVARAIRIAKDSGIDMLIAVSTENPAIAEVAHQEGVTVIDRPLELAGDEVSTIPVVKHAMEHMDTADWRADIIISIQPTCPYTPPEALDQGLLRVQHEEIDSAVSIAEVTGTHPYRAYTMEGTVLSPFFPDYAERYLQRQDRPTAYGFTGGFYIRKRKLLEKWDGKGYALGNCSGIVVPEHAAVDIDSKLDLWLAEAIMKHQGEL